MSMLPTGYLSRNRRLLLTVPVLLFAGAVVVYLRTLAPGVLGGDVGELQFVPHILSMAHPTGTPVYTLVGRVWSMLPLGPSVAWRMNLLSAVSASLALVLIYRLLLGRTGHAIPALAATLSLAFGATFWEQAIMADKYAFNALIVSLLLLLTLRWGATRSPTALNLLVLTYGFALTHHRTMILFAPTIFGYVWWHERRALWRDWRRLLRLVLLLLAPLLFYLYLPWAAARNLPPGSWHADSIGGWIRTILNLDAVGYVYIDSDVGELLLFYLRTLQHDFTWAGVLLGVAGLVWQLRCKPADGMFLLVTAVLHAFLAANHHLRRQWTFFIPSFIIFTIWIGEGLGIVWKSMRILKNRSRPSRATVAAVLAVGMLALFLVPFPGRYDAFRVAHLGAGVLDPWRQELKQGLMGERLGRALGQVEPDAVIAGDWEQVTPLWYYQQVEGWRPDVRIVYPIERLGEFADIGRPLYVTRTVPDLWRDWHPSSAGPLVALHSGASTTLPTLTPLGIQLGDAFRLEGFVYGEAAFQPATVVPLTLYWRALQTPAHDYSVSVRLFDAAGQEIYRVDSQSPVLGTFPTTAWTEGEVVADYYEIQLPVDLPAGSYQWGVILYRALPDGGWENLNPVGSTSEVALGGRFAVGN